LEHGIWKLISHTSSVEKQKKYAVTCKPCEVTWKGQLLVEIVLKWPYVDTYAKNPKIWLFQVTSQGLQVTAYFFRFSTLEVWDISFQMPCSKLYYHIWNDFYGFLKFDKILPNFGIFGP